MDAIKLADFEFTAQHRYYISQVLMGRQVSPGHKVMDFEKRFGALHGLKHAIFINSGTDALRLALLALKEKYGWQDGDQVLVPALTFVATVNTVLQAGLEPVLVDISMHDYGINAWRYLPIDTVWNGKEYEPWSNRPMPEKVRAVIPVHVAGQMCDMDSVMKLAKLFDLKVIEDSCETMLATYQGQMCGTFGDVACFSTYAAHLVTTGSGGLACTQDDELASLIRSYANHGRNTDYLPPYHATGSRKDLIKNRFRFDRLGYSCRSTELDAAVGLGELEGLEANIKTRQANAAYLSHLLWKHRYWLNLPGPMPYRSHSFMFYPVHLAERSGVQKYDLLEFLEAGGVESRDLLPILDQPCYKGRFKRDDYPTASYMLDNAFYLPCHPGVSAEALQHIAGLFDAFVEREKVAVKAA